MLNLIKLEIKKFKLGGIIKGFLIATLCITAVICLPVLTPKSTDKPYNDFGDIVMMIDTFVRVVFIIYGSAMISKLVISEFKNKTINLMFMYPINRKKIVASKLIIVSMFTFMSIIIGNIIVALSMFLLNKYINFVSVATSQVICRNIIPILLNAVASSGIVLIPLLFGMWKKTTTSTIVSGVILTSLICSNGNGISLSQILPATLSIGGIGVLIAYLTIKNIENVDVV